MKLWTFSRQNQVRRSPWAVTALLCKLCFLGLRLLLAAIFIRPVRYIREVSVQGPEKRHAAVEKEVQAIIETVRQWKHYLTRRHFTLKTDQRSISYMFNKHQKKQDKEWQNNAMAHGIVLFRFRHCLPSRRREYCSWHVFEGILFSHFCRFIIWNPQDSLSSRYYSHASFLEIQEPSIFCWWCKTDD